MNHRTRRAHAAFTLLETLLAVLVLGLGLLGLVSVFPAVVAQQRDASETIRAGSIAATIDGQVGPTDGILRGLIEQSPVELGRLLERIFRRPQRQTPVQLPVGTGLAMDGRCRRRQRYRSCHKSPRSI